MKHGSVWSIYSAIIATNMLTFKRSAEVKRRQFSLRRRPVDSIILFAYKEGSNEPINWCFNMEATGKQTHEWIKKCLWNSIRYKDLSLSRMAQKFQ